MQIRFRFFLFKLVKDTRILAIYLSILCHTIIMTSAIQAKENAIDALNSPVGSTLAHLNLGVASNGDSSVVDINPALLTAIEKQYSLFGSTNFNSGLKMYEAGITDSVFTPVDAVLKFRQTTKSTTSIDRFFRLGLAYRIPETNLSFGISGTYIQHELHNWIKSQESGGSVGVGALYQVNFQKTAPLFLGFSILNILDRFQNTSFNFGLSKGFVNNLVYLHGDASIQSKYEHPRVAGGVDIQIKRFFYLRGSVGWNFIDKVMPVGGGIFFDGPKLKAFYSIATHQVNTKGVWQSVGLILKI